MPPSAKPLKRKRLRPANPERKRMLYVRNYLSDEYREWLCEFDCIVPGCYRRPVQAAHGYHSKGGSGTWEDLVPLCATDVRSGTEGHHDEQHRLGRDTFAAKYGLDMEIIARAYVSVWRERGGGDPTPLAESRDPSQQHEGESEAQD